ncbi:MAG: hypothetical protein Kow0029_23330 [Candidatus Rifleibacteriota bacterium]
MNRKSVSEKNSIFLGLIFILVAAITFGVGIIWKSFVEYTGNAEELPDVFSGITTQPPFIPTSGPHDRDQVIFTFTIPRGDLVQFLEMVQPKLDKIVAKTGKQAVIDISADEVEVINKIEHDQADFGSLSTMGFVNFMDSRNIRAVMERYSDPPKKSLFIVRKDDNIRSIADLHGKRIAFKNKYSLPGYLLPLNELKSSGFDPHDFFQQESFSENYSNSMLGLLNGEYDCIVVSSNFLMEVPMSQREQIKVIHESKDLPGGVYIARKDRKMSFEQIITGNFMKLSDTISPNEKFAGMFKVRHPDLESYRLLAEEYRHGKR